MGRETEKEIDPLRLKYLDIAAEAMKKSGIEVSLLRLPAGENVKVVLVSQVGTGPLGMSLEHAIRDEVNLNMLNAIADQIAITKGSLPEFLGSNVSDVKDILLARAIDEIREIKRNSNEGIDVRPSKSPVS